MDCFCDVHCHTVVLMWGAQLAKSEVLLNILGYVATTNPGPVLMVQPTIKMGQTFSRERIATMIRDTEALAPLFGSRKTRTSDNTLDHKAFPGGQVDITGANSPASLASRPVRDLLTDEIDRWPVSAGAEGDPLALADQRTQNFWNRTRVRTSTPTVKGASLIEREYLNSDRRRYNVPCPHCNQSFIFADSEDEFLERFKFEIDNDSGKVRPDAFYQCPHCAGEVHDRHKSRMLDRGEWVAERPFAGVAGFKINAFYSPWLSFQELAQDYIDKKDSDETYKTFLNTKLAITWEIKGEVFAWESVRDRAEDYNGVPEPVLYLTAGVDVQADRFEIEVVGWGNYYTSWLIDYRVLWGDLTQSDIWDELAAYLLKTKWIHPSGREIKVEWTFIDSGYLTKQVYDFCRARQKFRVFASKGKQGANRPIVSAPTEVKDKAGRRTKLFVIGTDEAKALVFARLAKGANDRGSMHFPRHIDDEYYRMLTAEKCVFKRVNQIDVMTFEKIRDRNEALDTRVLNTAAIKILQPNWVGRRHELYTPENVTVTQEPRPTPPPSSRFSRKGL